ncbi:MAG: hypothetical protein CVU57_03675 [Deltaproteobacteria bacterium HGW-Deltaproteobacteria-15]|jgi:uncharacterized membrane protein|nr:MAG: hypothetical protein CVU57_03675 [Deltaproteobacteria bacterium HGW-Deltaproteobacteria-15]
MGKVSSGWTIFAAMIVIFLGGTVPAWSQEKGTTSVRTMSAASIDLLLGKEVKDPQGTRLGHIGGILLAGGSIAYLILNIAEEDGTWRHIPVPSSVAEFLGSEGAVVVGLEKRMLSDAPAYSGQDRPDFSDPEWERQIHSYYGERSPDRELESYILIRR